MKSLPYLLLFSFILCQCQSNTGKDSEIQTPGVAVITQAPGEPTTTALSEDADGPRITFDKVRHHFGSIWHAEKVHYGFTFKNSGSDPLVITEVKTSCGCTQPTYPKEPIGPGQEGVVEVTYNSVGKQGGQRATIRVFTNDPVHPETELKLLGTVKVKPREQFEKEQEAKKAQSDT